MFPAKVRVSGVLSPKPAAEDLIANVPVTLSVPVAPANFPVPPDITALPVIVTTVGAALSAAQPFAEESKLTLMLFPPPLITPEPSMPAHWSEGEEEPVPVNESSPAVVPVPEPVTDEACTPLSLQRTDILPLYVPLKATELAFAGVLAEGFGVTFATGFFVVHPFAHTGLTAVTFFTAVPL